MSALAESLMMAGGSNSAVGSFNGVDYVDDVFSTYLYTGNGSEQTIANGIDLSTSDKVATFVGRLQASDAAASDNFGNAVAVSADGNTMIVSAQLDDNSGGSNAGSAYIFTRSGGVWSHQARLQASDALANDQFSISVSLNADGNTAAVGAWQDDNSGGADAGSVYIFTRTDGVWTQQARLQSTTPAATDYFGYAVSLSSTGDIIAIGSHYDDNSGGTNAGSAYIFTRSGVTWTQQARVQASDAAANDQIAYSLSLSADGKTLAVGAHGDDNSGGVDAGSVYIYTETGGVWSQQARLQASDAATSDYFGYAVSISADGNTLAVGAHCNNTNAGADAGSVYIFTRSGVTWSQQADIQPSNAYGGDTFGYSVSISADGNTLAVGASWDDSNGAITDNGSAYLFTRTGSVWTQQLRVQAIDAAATDYFGYSVSVSGDGSVMVVGANADDNSGGVDAGSVYTYSISNSTRTNRGGMVWIKNRDAISNHYLFDTKRGINKPLYSDSNGLQGQIKTLTSFNTDGFDVALDAGVNVASNKFTSWSFRIAPKFFDTITYTGNGVTGINRVFSHSLGISPGMIIIKRTDATAGWAVWHRTFNSDRKFVYLNSTTGVADLGEPWITSDATSFSIVDGTTYSMNINAAGATYVAYIFAHDTSPNGVVQCGNFTTDGTGDVSLDFGWEPQFLMVKRTSSVDDWRMFDCTRGISNNSLKRLKPNTQEAEFNQTYSNALYLTPTGISTNGELGAGDYIYMAIRRPNKPPTSGTQVYAPLHRTGTGAAGALTVGFPIDMLFYKQSNGNGYTWRVHHRLDTTTGGRALAWSSSGGTLTESNISDYTQNGIMLGTGMGINGTGSTYTMHFFRRAPGVFDVVRYIGNGSSQIITHNLDTVPELMMVKRVTGGASDWAVYTGDVTKSMKTNLTSAQAVDDVWNNTAPTRQQLSVSIGAAGQTNTNGSEYVAFLFATKAGISKVGKYTGNGTSQTINCGFTTGARFVLVKRLDAVGEWHMWDTARGIIAGNDPHLALNNNTANITTDDSIDPDVTGFIVNHHTDTNINVALAEYVFLAIA